MTKVSRVVYTRNTPLNYDSYNICADPLQRGRHFDLSGVYFHIHLLGGVYKKYTTCVQNRDQRVYIYIYVDNAYLHVRVGSLTLAQLQLVICKVAETG